jgi:hypothetical protein
MTKHQSAKISVKVASWKFLWVISISTFIVGLMAYSVVALQGLQGDNEEPPRAFTIWSKEYKVTPDGSTVLLSNVTQEVEANGAWTVTKYPVKRSGWVKNEYSGGKLNRTNSNGGKVTRDLGRQASPYSEAARKMRTEAYYKNNPDFIKGQKLLGLDVYGLKQELKGGQGWLEQWHSPKTGEIPLKAVFYFPDGTRVVREAVSIEFK